MGIEFIDLQAQRLRIKDQIDTAVATVMDHGRFVMGPEVREFEAQLAQFGQAKYALGCANGTDALILPLMAWSIGPGDAVFCPSFTYCATAEAIAIRGATPVFVDIDRDTYNMCPANLEQAISEVTHKGELRPRAIIAVDLFGQTADYPTISHVAKQHGLKLISDSAQAFGATLDGHHPLHWADIATTSFFPAKPLGCYGDGGAILTDDEALMSAIDSLRIHGKGTDKYDNVRVGLNSRLDTLQAAILLQKLAIFEDEIQKRGVIAQRYNNALKDHVLRIPTVIKGGVSTWAQYSIEVAEPDNFAATLRTADIPTARYYPKPIHKQTAYVHFPVSGNGLAHTDDAANTVISLPMHAYLDVDTQDRIIDAAIKAVQP